MQDVRERSMIVPTVMAVSCPSMGEKLNANVLGSTDYAYTDGLRYLHCMV